MFKPTIISQETTHIIWVLMVEVLPEIFMEFRYEIDMYRDGRQSEVEHFPMDMDIYDTLTLAEKEEISDLLFNYLLQ